LIKDKTIKKGFGVIYTGTVMATETVNGDLVPYAPATPSHDDQARAFITEDTGSTATSCKIPLADSYKFSVGDEIIIHENAATPVYTDGGAITAIDRDTYPGIAEVTWTTALSSAATVANDGNIYHKAGSASPYNDASFICDQDVFTGEDADALGANTSVVISNAILYKSALVGYDAAAASDLGAVDDGPHVILK